MGLMNEYLKKRMSGNDLETELLKLIAGYKKITGHNLLIFSSSINKPIPNIAISMDDYYIIADLLRETSDGTLDVYIETPGGSGEAAEAIVNYLRSKYTFVNFVVSGEAKSAGTIIVLSGDEISMTQTGSLGPIDAQMSIGRCMVSAHDYMEWVNNKQEEAIKNGTLNAFDATMIAQITPGELNGVNNALEYAHELVVKWLPKYKFKKWEITEARGIKVTPKMRQDRAKEIAMALTDHSKWRSHGRSLGIPELNSINLKINSISDDSEIGNIINRIQVVLRLIYSTTSIYKYYAIDGSKITASATSANSIASSTQTQSQQPDIANIEISCPKCGMLHKLYLKLSQIVPEEEVKLKKNGQNKFPNNSKQICSCGFEIDLTGIKNQIEVDTGKKMVE